METQTPLWLRVLKVSWIAWLIFGVFIIHSCDSDRDARVHPVSEEEAEGMMLLRER